MAIYTNMTQVASGNHGIAQSSLLKSTSNGHIWDVRVQEAKTESGTTTYTDIDVDNGTNIKVLGFTGTNGDLQERTGVVAGAKDKVGLVLSVPIVKDAFTKNQASETNFYVKAGELARVYELQGDEFDPDIFGVGLQNFSNADLSDVVVNAYVVVDGTGKWKAQAAAPSASAYGFIGKIHSIQNGAFYTLVRIAVLQNKDVN